MTALHIKPDSVFAALLSALLVLSCSSPRDPNASTDPALDLTCLAPLNTAAGGNLVRVADLTGDVALRYAVQIDPNDARLFKPVNVADDDPDAGLFEQQPQFGAATISAPVNGVTLDVAIKRPTQRPDLMWMEWFCH